MQDKIKGITNRQMAGMVAVMLFIAIVSILVSRCNCSRQHTQANIDSTDFKLMKSFIEKKLIKGKIKMRDSIDKVLVQHDTIFVDRWHKAKENAKLAPDTCHQYIQRLINACDSMARHKDSISNNLRLKMADQKVLSAKDSSDIALLYSAKAKADSTIFALENKLAKAIKQKKNWRTAALVEGGYILMREGKPILFD